MLKETGKASSLRTLATGLATVRADYEPTNTTPWRLSPTNQQQVEDRMASMFVSGPVFFIENHHHHHHPQDRTWEQTQTYGTQLSTQLATLAHMQQSLMHAVAMSPGDMSHFDPEQLSPARTTPKVLVDQLPCRTATSGAAETNCSICLSQFENGDSVRKLPCGHEFHSSCIETWLLNHSRTCPCCRLDLCEHEEKIRAHQADSTLHSGFARTDIEVLMLLSVRELKMILRSRGVECSDCVEKRDLVDRIRALPR